MYETLFNVGSIKGKKICIEGAVAGQQKKPGTITHSQPVRTLYYLACSRCLIRYFR